MHFYSADLFSRNISAALVTTDFKNRKVDLLLDIVEIRWWIFISMFKVET